MTSQSWRACVNLRAGQLVMVLENATISAPPGANAAKARAQTVSGHLLADGDEIAGLQ
jgi:hypothetical protein